MYRSNTFTVKNLWLPVGILTLCFAALYHEVVLSLVNDWMIDDNYSHGFFIPAIAAYLIWHDRSRFKTADIRPADLGLLVLAGGLCLFLLGNIGAELFITRFSMLVVLFGLVIYLAGWQFGRKLAVPIGYLVFMIPLPAIIWNKIAFPLKLFATTIAANVISAVNISVYREGNIIHLAQTSLEVVDACSGLRSLASLLALSGAFAFISNLSKWGKWLLFLSAVPIAIVVNIFRLTATAILAQFYGEGVAQGFLHDMSGILVFVVAFIFLYLVYLILDRLKMTSQRPTNPDNPVNPV